jgi:hypothetical protein
MALLISAGSHLQLPGRCLHHCPTPCLQAVVPPPPGLSSADVAELFQAGVPDQEALLALKLGLLGLLGAAALTPAPLPSEAAEAGAGAVTSNAAAAAGGDAMDTDEAPQQPAAAVAAASSGMPAAAAGGSSGGSKRPAMLLSPEVVLPHLLVAACDPYEAVAR